VTTPPRPAPDEVAAAIDRITSRRRRIDDPHQELLSDEPAEVLDYLRRYSGRVIPDAIQADDIADAIILRHHLWWQGEATESWLLEKADRLGIPRPQLAEMLGLRTSQGVAERRFRLSEKLHGRRPRRMSHPDVDREPPRPADDERALPPDDVLGKWLTDRVSSLDRYAEVLLVSRDLDLTDETYETVGELRDMTSDPGRGVPWWVQLTLTAVALSADPAVQALPPAHTLRRTLRRLDDLSDQWVQLRRADKQRTS
jgi:hypothetical protein